MLNDSHAVRLYELLGTEIINILPDVLVLTDSAYNILAWNRQATIVFGYQTPDILGQSIHRTIFHAESTQTRFKSIEAYLEHNPLWEGELPLELPNGKQDWPILRIRRIPLSDGSYGLLILNTQLVGYELRDKNIQNAMDSSQKELSDILLAVGDVVCAYDIDEDTVEFVSPSCEQLTGYTDIEIIERENLFLDMIHPEDKHLIEEAFSAVKDGEVTKVEYRIRRRDGKIIWIRNSMTPNISIESDTTRVTCVMTDTTAYHELNDLKSRMIQMASHDLNNPLSIAIGFFSLMIEDLGEMLPEHLVFYANSINEAHEHMSRMLAELLDLEQLESKDHLELVPTELVTLVTTVIREYSSQLYKYKHELTFDHPDHEIIVASAEVQLRHAFGNLLGNAIKYTPEGGTIQVQIWTEGNRAIVEVVDNGIGVPEHFQANLFEPFKRAKQTGTEHIKGTGLGLSLVKSIINQHEGEVYYRPNPQGGSIFGFWLILVS